MACLQTLNGLAASCESSLAGIKEIYIANRDDVANFNLSKTADGELSAYTTSSVTMNSGKTFYHYSVPQEICSLTSSFESDETIGLRAYTNSLVLRFNKLEARKHMEVAALSRGHLAVIAEDNNGIRWILGADTYAKASAATAQTGAGYADGNYYELTIDARSKYLPIACTMADADFAAIVTEPAI